MLFRVLALKCLPHHSSTVCSPRPKRDEHRSPSSTKPPRSAKFSTSLNFIKGEGLLRSQWSHCSNSHKYLPREVREIQYEENLPNDRDRHCHRPFWLQLKGVQRVQLFPIQRCQRQVNVRSLKVYLQQLLYDPSNGDIERSKELQAFLRAYHLLWRPLQSKARTSREGEFRERLTCTIRFLPTLAHRFFKQQFRKERFLTMRLTYATQHAEPSQPSK